LYFDTIPVRNNYLFLLNLTNSAWVSSDYYPLFPWLGVFLYGISIGRILYPGSVSLFGGVPRGTGLINFLGRHTLTVYLVHQPVLIFLIGIFGKLMALLG